MKHIHHSDILFILKRNLNYNFVSYTRRSSGLWNSTRFIVESLRSRGVHAEIVEVHDNNDIDREVTKHRPKIIVVEALWVVPEKFPILRKLHPNVKWFVHMHSGMPFLAQEGVAMDWISRYPEEGVGIIANSEESFDAFSAVLSEEDLTFLPNVYISNPKSPICIREDKFWLDIGCFGAIRPMKNQLLQAMAAIEFAKQRFQFLCFHINASRVEVGGDPVLKNLRQLFEHQDQAKLVEHPWFEPEEFIEYLHGNMDIGMQVSLTETFNVVSADYVTAGVPIVVSKEVSWASCFSKAKDDEIHDIVQKMHRAYMYRRPLVLRNQTLLQRFSRRAQHMWYEWFREECETECELV